QGAVQQRAHAVAPRRAGAEHLLEEARPQQSPQRAARVVRAEGHEEGRRDPRAVERARDPGHALVERAVVADVDLERDLGAHDADRATTRASAPRAPARAVSWRTTYCGRRRTSS